MVAACVCHQPGHQENASRMELVSAGAQNLKQSVPDTHFLKC